MQISVVVPDEIIPVLDRLAARDCRTRSAQACFYVVEALRRAGHSTAGLPAWPPPLEPVAREDFPGVKLKVQAMQIERDKLVAAGEQRRTSLIPHHQERLLILP